MGAIAAVVEYGTRRGFLDHPPRGQAMHLSFDPAPRPFVLPAPTTAELLARGREAIRESVEVCQATRELIRATREMQAQFRRAHREEFLA